MKDLLLQLRQLWQQLGINQRVSIGVAVLGVVVGMSALVAWSHRPQMQLLYGKLSEKDVAEVIAAAQASGTTYEIGSGGNSVYVPADQVYKLRAQIASKGVLTGEGVGYEIFDRANFGISDFVQRTNYVRALQGELARTITQFQGVRSARVLVVMPENRLLFTDVKTKPTASVFIDGNVGIDTVNSVRFLVANSVEGLRADDVAVVDNRGTVLTEGLKDDPQLGTASSQMKLRKSVEDYFSNKVETMLAKVLGPGNSVVRVSADLETESTTRTEERFDPEGQVVRSDTNTLDTTITQETDGNKSTASGVTPNSPAAPGDPGKTAGKSSEQSRSNKTLNYEINRVVTNAVRAPGSVSRITASVFVAAKGTNKRTKEEMEALRKIVTNAIGIKSTDDKLITLEEVAFEPVPVQTAGVVDIALNHSDWFKHGIAVAVALGLIIAFTRMLKKAQPDQIPIEILETTRLENGPNGGGEISVDMLNEMIRQKPENVGAALRDWMTPGAKN